VFPPVSVDRSVTPLAARAQQAAKLPTIGFLGAVGVDAALTMAPCLIA